MSTAKVTWVGPGMRSIAQANDSPTIVIDTHSDSAPQGGPSPMELILMGAAGCTAMDVVSIMSKKRQPLTGLEVRVEAEKARTHPMVYTKIHLEYVAYGKGVDETALKRAIELSEETYCSVNAMLKKAVEVTWSYRIVEDQPTPYLPGQAPEA